MGNVTVRPDHLQQLYVGGGGGAEPEMDAGGETGEIAAASAHLAMEG